MANGSQPAECPKKLVRITSLVGASPSCAYPVFSHQTEPFTATKEREDATSNGLVNILRKEKIEHEKEVLNIFGHYAKGKPNSVWASNTLPWDINIPMTTSPPPLPNFMQAFVICVGRPPLLLSLYDKGEYSADVEDYAKETARLLHWSLLGFCHLDFQVLKCCMTFEELQSVTDLERVVNKEMNIVERYFRSPLLLSEFTFSKLKEATTALVGSTFVPCLLEHEQNTKMWMLMMDTEWTDKMSLLMESLHKGDGQYTPLKDDPIIALEAAKRISFSGEVKIQCTTDSVCRCLKRLIDHIKEDFNVSLQLTVNHMPHTGNEGREMLQLKTTATELQLKMQRTVDLILDGQLPQLCQYQVLEDKEFLDKFTEFYDSNQEQNNGVLHAGDNEYDLPLLYWSAVHSSTELTKWCLKTMGEKAIETRDLAELESLLCAAIAAILFAPTESDVRFQAKCLLAKLIETEPKLKKSPSSKLTLPLPRQFFSKAKISDLRTRFQSGALCYLDDPSLPIPATLLSVTVTEDAVSVELPSQHWYLALRLLADRKVEKTNLEDKRDGSCSMLHAACKAKQVETASLLIRLGCDVSAEDSGGNTALHFLCKADDTTCVKMAKLLIDEYGVDISTANKDGYTGLHFACESGSADMARLLINHDADINCKTKHLSTPLHLACQNAQEETVRLLIENRAEFCQDVDGSTPLHLACKSGGDKITELCLNHADADVNTSDHNRNTPLHYHLWKKGGSRVAERLTEKVTTVNNENHTGLTYLHLASMNGYTDIVQMLIERGASKNAKIQKYQRTALHMACIFGQADTARQLLLQSVDVNETDCYGRTALHYACSKGKDKIVDLLLKSPRPVDLNLQDNKGHNAFHAACCSGNSKLVRKLLQNPQVNVMHSDYNGNTALHLLCTPQKGNEDMMIKDYKNTIGLLLKNKDIDVNAKNNDTGATALHLAIDLQLGEAVTQLLESDKIDVNAVDSAGQTPLHWACVIGDLDIIRLLLRKKSKRHIQNRQGQTPLDVAQPFPHYRDVKSVLKEKLGR